MPEPHAPSAAKPLAETTVDTLAPPFSAEDFRSALGQFATGVTIVTARDAEGKLVGLTANSFNSVSLSPPLVLWSLARQSSAMPGMRSATHYAINVLAAEQRLLAERFARKGIDRFEGVAWQPGFTGAPVIDGAVAVFECAHHGQHDAGDHLILVGQVAHCHRRVGAAPLLYHGGRFLTDLGL